jgi:hypothetical protein
MMSKEKAVNQNYERTLIEITRSLPPNRVEQVVDFARFLEAQLLNETILEEERSEEVQTDNARWDALLEKNDSQALLERLADEALAEHREGKTRPIAFNDEGKIVPG